MAPIHFCDTSPAWEDSSCSLGLKVLETFTEGFLTGIGLGIMILCPFILIGLILGLLYCLVVISIWIIKRCLKRHETTHIKAGPRVKEAAALATEIHKVA